MLLKENKNRIIAGVLLFLIAAFTFLQFKDISALRGRYPAVSVRINKEGITEHDINWVLKAEKDRGAEDIPEVTAWIRYSKTEIRSNELNRIVNLSPTIILGNMEAVVPMTVIRGNLVYMEDKNGCVVDANTAYKLFGTEKAEGNRVVYSDKSYYVRGVVKSKYPLFLIQGEDSDIKYKNLELLFHHKERGEEFAQNFIYQNALASDFTVVDGYFYSKAAGTLLSIPLWLFYLAAVVWVVRIYMQNKAGLKLPVFLAFGTIGILALAGYGILLAGYAGMPFYFPEKLIPTKWSDFEYWSRQFKIINEQLSQMSFLEPNPKDILLREELIRLPYKLVISTIIYSVLFVCLMSNIKGKQFAQIL